MKKHLSFKKVSATFGGINRICVFNSHDTLLGNIDYFSQWKCFIWEQNQGIIMSKSCLDELTAFMGKLEANKKYGRF